MFTAFPSDKKFCPVACLRGYEKRTEDKRTPNKKEPRPLFLSYVKPYKPVTSQRVAYWIKELLELAGVNTSEFGAHSVRGASTTAALKKGVGLDLILQVADWSKNSTFRQFYYRPAQTNPAMEFGKAVLKI